MMKMDCDFGGFSGGGTSDAQSLQRRQLLDQMSGFNRETADHLRAYLRTLMEFDFTREEAAAMVRDYHAEFTRLLMRGRPS